MRRGRGTTSFRNSQSFQREYRPKEEFNCLNLSMRLPTLRHNFIPQGEDNLIPRLQFFEHALAVAEYFAVFSGE